jgi:hypothetical protein
MATSAMAQAAADSAPKRGTIGAEVGLGSYGLEGPRASLIGFVSPRLAVTGAFGVSRVGLSGGGSVNSMSASLGVRRYLRAGLGVRPVIGVGATFLRGDLPGATGGYAEAGAIYFFTPHVSLGALGEATVRRQSGFTNWSAGVARLVGAVYF